MIQPHCFRLSQKKKARGLLNHLVVMVCWKAGSKFLSVESQILAITTNSNFISFILPLLEFPHSTSGFFKKKFYLKGGGPQEAQTPTMELHPPLCHFLAFSTLPFIPYEKARNISSCGPLFWFSIIHTFPFGGYHTTIMNE